MKITIVSPGHLASNPRVVKEATALSDAGHEVCVIHGCSLKRLKGADRSVENLKWKIRSVAFGRECAGSARHFVQTCRTRGAILAFKLRQEWLADTANSPVTIDLTRAALDEPSDLFIAHYTAALPAVAKAAKRHGSYYAFDAEDYHLGDLPDESRHDLKRRIINAIESRYLNDASFITAASPGIADAYVRQYGVRRPKVILNVFARSDAPATVANAGSIQPRPSIYWFSQTIGPNRGLECAIIAIGKARTRPHLYLRGIPSKGFDGNLIKLAKQHGVSDRLHFLPVAPPAQMLHLASQYDVGLVAETGETLNRRIALTNKQFTYLLAGVPSIMSDIPAHQQFLQRTKGASFLYQRENPYSLAEAVDRVLGNPKTLADARIKAFNLGHTVFNWEREQKKLLEAVGSVKF